jgi:alkanesulfonate monooxygenase SsuD/methylene tetrahydromethanopterin reductase-like flavin-dependent oxidoreductase (luciferase family)
MRFGLSFLPDASPHTKPADEYYRDALALSELADQAGMATVKITEHYAQPYGGYCPDPLLFLTAVAQRTRTIRLMTGCLLPAFHHPVQLACRIAQADVLCGGRLDIGLARAFLPTEFQLLGIDIDESRSRYEAVIGAMQALFTQQPCSRSSPYFNFEQVSLLPPPVQTPHPPFWGAAARSRESFAWIAEQGYNLLTAYSVQAPAHLQAQLSVYRQTLQAHHGVETRRQITMLVPLYVDEDDARARRMGVAYMARYHAVWAQAAQAWRGKSSVAYPGYTDMHKQISSASPQQMLADGSLVFGDPSRVRDRIETLKALFDVDQILWNIDFGAMPGAQSRRSVELLLERVLT